MGQKGLPGLRHLYCSYDYGRFGIFVILLPQFTCLVSDFCALRLMGGLLGEFRRIFVVTAYCSTFSAMSVPYSGPWGVPSRISVFHLGGGRLHCVVSCVCKTQIAARASSIQVSESELLCQSVIFVDFVPLPLYIVPISMSQSPFVCTHAASGDVSTLLTIPWHLLDRRLIGLLYIFNDKAYSSSSLVPTCIFFNMAAFCTMPYSKSILPLRQ